MSWLTDLIGKGVDKIWPDKSKAREQQVALNQEELKSAPASKLRLWRSALGCVLVLCLVWEVIARPIMATYWPEIPLPPSKLEEVGKLLLFMLGGAF